MAFLRITITLLLFGHLAFGQGGTSKVDPETALRMIGHSILMQAGDSTSRVLPVTKEKSRYSLSFDTPFSFVPEDLVATIRNMARETGLPDSYLVELEKCDTDTIVYSFEVMHLEDNSIIPCKSREQPKGCFNLYFTFKNDQSVVSIHPNADDDNSNASGFSPSRSMGLVGILLLVSAGGFFYLRKQKPQNSNVSDTHIIPIGDYRFDTRSTELIHRDQKVELTGKEAELLILLYDSVNTTVEREVLLNMVWGDQGDYVGRTLDVFISKLRKKLHADARVKIVNIRGIGYKLVMNS